ncbi:ABC transporter related protein [Segniliparus rotundus DSM 44985]|uniref:ABC transporter related protein n=1 Tax=Segniliparus rotundus (strain ATCC BAA-972 / CDC 1076 / CIP 108378 / DSM 44985 / JCM 13578) TaxID=640132 RepID=D6ZAE5_SEGRD|nr:ATP-binding cassette domain-containing protein [Segniliparus rotundus]ADG96687.1 ABC transporter related protein [Segniliparus rotundus DSM 44985]
MPDRPAEPALRFSAAALRVGERVLVENLDLALAPGEFLAVLGPNGAGKSTLVQAALGLRALDAGSVEIFGQPPARARDHIGYLAQRVELDRATALRGRDFVGFGYDGFRLGPGFLRAGRRKTAVARTLARLGAEDFADRPVSGLSGGEFARLRLAQALIGDPKLLICDEPLVSLDLASQTLVVEQIVRQQQERGAAVVFITHELNPVLAHVDRVLYVARGGHRHGPVDEVMTAASLSALYASPIDVLNVRGKLVVVGAGEEGHG